MQRAAQLQGGLRVEVRRYRQVPGLRHVPDAHELGDAADASEVRHQHIRRLGLYQRAEAVAGVFGLTGGDRRVERGGERGVAGHVIRRHRLLEPVEADRLQRAAESERMPDIEPLVRIRHQPDIGADGVADRLGALDILLPARLAEPHLHGAEALLEEGLRLGDELVPRAREPEPAAVIGRHGVAAGAEQAVDWLAERLAARIPERHVERREREQRHALVADEVHLGPEPVPDAFDPVRVLADERLSKHGGHRLQRRQVLRRQRENVALTRHVRIGIDEDQHIADRADIVDRGDDGLLQRHVHRHRANTGNLHPCSCLRENSGSPNPPQPSSLA